MTPSDSKPTKPIYGRRALSAGLYLVGEAPTAYLELDVDEALEAHGLVDTPENREMLLNTALKACSEAAVHLAPIKGGSRHKHFCPAHKGNWLHAGSQEWCEMPHRSYCPPCQS